MKMEKVFRFRASETDIGVLDAIAKRLQRSKSDIVRILIRNFSKNPIFQNDRSSNSDLIFGDSPTLAESSSTEPKL
jgi:hypothetical protein